MNGLRAFVGILVLLAASAPAASAADGEVLGGWEADSHHNGYAFAAAGYAHPVTRRLALATRVSAGYLYYRFVENGGETRVTSPNGTLLIGPRISGDRVNLTILGGAEVSTVRRESSLPFVAASSRTGVHAVVNGTLWAHVAEPLDLLAVANYDAANRYTWARGAAKYRVTGASAATGVSVGPEVTGQGNSDIRSFQAGGVVQLLRPASRISVEFRGGYKRSAFDQGPSQTGGYWGLGVYAPF